jgi:RHH-type rel operon transcriptional repressor/antitoxin RelB
MGDACAQRYLTTSRRSEQINFRLWAAPCCWRAAAPASASYPSAQQPTSSRSSTKPRRAIKPSKIRDVNFTVPARVHAAVFSRPAATQGSVLYCKRMNTETFSVRLDPSAKKRLQKLAKSTGRSRAFLASEAITAYLDTNEWQISGIARALGSLDRGKGITHTRVSEWVASWETRKERRPPRGV